MLYLVYNPKFTTKPADISNKLYINNVYNEIV